MADDPTTDPSARPPITWRDRYAAARARGVALDPQSEPVEGVTAYPTSYDPSHLLITDAERLDGLLELLAVAAGDFGWGVSLQNLDGTPLDPEDARARERRAREAFDIPTIHRVFIYRAPREDRDDQPVPPVDAWRLLQRARARAASDRARLRSLERVGLDHVLSVDPIGGKTNPVGGKTNPVGGKTNAPGPDSYNDPGCGGRQVVQFIGAEPERRLPLGNGGRRPVVAILDTGCGHHAWLPDSIVARYPLLENKVVGAPRPTFESEVLGDVAGPFDGFLDEAAGHGTFIAGIIRQLSPEADIISIRVADSQGTLLEGDFMLAIRTLVKMMSLPKGKGGRAVDVMNLSVSYYHETPDDQLFDRTLTELLIAARRRGCAVVCSAGNDSTDRPAFPAALWRWKGSSYQVPDPSDAAPHVSVGALNPNGTMALFSNLGPWVRTYAPGAAVVSTFPGFNGGIQAGTRDDRADYRRETIDPDDFSGGFGLWSGTSFAAPYVAGMLARAVSERWMSGVVDSAERVKVIRGAGRAVLKELQARGPRPS